MRPLFQFSIVQVSSLCPASSSGARGCPEEHPQIWRSPRCGAASLWWVPDHGSWLFVNCADFSLLRLLSRAGKPLARARSLQSSDCDSRWGTGTERELGVLTANSLVSGGHFTSGTNSSFRLPGASSHTQSKEGTANQRQAQIILRAPPACSPSLPSCLPGGS